MQKQRDVKVPVYFYIPFLCLFILQTPSVAGCLTMSFLLLVKHL